MVIECEKVIDGEENLLCGPGTSEAAGGQTLIKDSLAVVERAST